ncbi:MAG: hypothetical protein H0U49_06425 [Parachlamydiaceae bacterium]|nr:hypothetical protein [Parachlamydiaceae bacterium]
MPAPNLNPLKQQVSPYFSNPNTVYENLDKLNNALINNKFIDENYEIYDEKPSKFDKFVDTIVRFCTFNYYSTIRKFEAERVLDHLHQDLFAQMFNHMIERANISTVKQEDVLSEQKKIQRAIAKLESSDFKDSDLSFGISKNVVVKMNAGEEYQVKRLVSLEKTEFSKSKFFHALKSEAIFFMKQMREIKNRTAEQNTLYSLGESAKFKVINPKIIHSNGIDKLEVLILSNSGQRLPMIFTPSSDFSIYKDFIEPRKEFKNKEDLIYYLKDLNSLCDKQLNQQVLKDSFSEFEDFEHSLKDKVQPLVSNLIDRVMEQRIKDKQDTTQLLLLQSRIEKLIDTNYMNFVANMKLLIKKGYVKTDKVKNYNSESIINHLENHLEQNSKNPLVSIDDRIISLVQFEPNLSLDNEMRKHLGIKHFKTA